MKVVLRVEEAEHQREWEEVLEEIQHAVEDLEANHDKENNDLVDIAVF